jgi:hypothetical protein
MSFVISTCTSVAHLSAGMGKRTHIILPILPFWVWAYDCDDDSSWYYQNVKLIRQTKFGEWEDVLNRLIS